MSGENQVSEWMRVMLEEIARKRAEQDGIRAEEERRSGEQSRSEERHVGAQARGGSN